MIPYFILIGFPLLISIVGTKKKWVKTATIVSFFFLFLLLLCCRHETVGVDLKTYRRIFESASKMGFSDIFSEITEPVYSWLSKLIFLINGDFQVVIIVCAFITLIPFWIFYCREVGNAYLAIVLFATVVPFSMFFSGLRQALAMALAVPLWYLAKNKKLIKFVIVLFLAFLCHQSALIMVLLYPLYHLRLSKRGVMLCTLALIFLIVFNRQIFSFLLRFLGDRYVDRYGAAVQATGSYMILILLIIFAIYSFLVPDENEIDRDLFAMRNILLLAIAIQMFSPVHNLAMRMNYYFLMFVPVLISRIPGIAKKKFQQLAWISVPIMCLFFMGYFIYNMYHGSDILEIYPYIAFWEG